MSDETPTTPPSRPGEPPTMASDPVGQATGSVGDYDLLGELASGGMGVVYRARQRSLNRVVALKMLLPGRVISDVGRARFRAEAEATAELDHPNIVPIFEVGEHAGRPFFSMKLIDGGTLADLLRRSPRPPLRELVAVLAKVCRAVHFAHQRGILHRDIKPGNVLLDSAGEPFVADFGLAKRVGSDDGLTVTGALLGTPAYMAPEQAGDTTHGVTTLTDVYALGAILYEVLAGRPPFQPRDLGILLELIRTEEPDPPTRVNPDAPRDLELVCLKCLSKEPGQRYASAGELAEELDRWLAGEPLAVRAPGLVSKVRIWVRHNSRKAFWVVVIGFTWGVFGPQLPITITIFSALMRNISQTMTVFPSVPGHWLVRMNWAVPAGGFWALLVVGAVLHLSVGMLTYMATRSRERWTHQIGGAVVGLIAGIIAFTLYLGPAALVATAVGPTIQDLGLLSGGFVTREPVPAPEGERPRLHPQDRLLARYPELAAVPEAERASLLYAKILAASMLGIYEGLILGMALTLLYALPVSIGGTLLAGHLVRRWGSPGAALVGYLEVFMAVSIGWFELIVLLVGLVGGVRLPAIGVMGWGVTALLMTLPLFAVLRGWGVRSRWRLYGMGFGLVATISVLAGGTHWLKPVVVGVYLPTLTLYLRYQFRGRAAPAPSAVPVESKTTEPPRSFPGSGET